MVLQTAIARDTAQFKHTIPTILPTHPTTSLISHNHNHNLNPPGPPPKKMPPTALLASKTAAITGGTTGIGRAITLGFLTQGCNVAVNHLGLASDAKHLSSLLEEAKAIKEKDAGAGELIEVQGDISSPETGKELVAKAVERWGGLDVFVSNAGVCKFAEVLE